VFNTEPYTVLPDNSILNTATMQSETGFPSSHQLKSYVASKSRLKLAARAVLSADAGLLVQCCWRESVSCLLYYCKVLPMSYIIDQRKLLFIKNIRTCDNSVIRSFSAICTHEYGKILSKYSIHNLCFGVAELKRSLWRHFVNTAIFS